MFLWCIIVLTKSNPLEIKRILELDVNRIRIFTVEVIKEAGIHLKLQ